MTTLRYLGDEGFSWDPEFGVYSGYTVAYVAAQLLAWVKPRSVHLIGVDLDYGVGASRFYGGRTSRTDQHVLGRQIANMRRAVHNMRSVGIDVTSCAPLPTWFVS